MALLVLAAPILPGKSDDFRRFAQEAVGNQQEYEGYRRRCGLTRELAWIQPTPQGDLLIVLLEGDDPIKGNRIFAASDHPYDRWFKQQLQSITGIDFNQPLPGAPELTAFNR